MGKNTRLSGQQVQRLWDGEELGMFEELRNHCSRRIVSELGGDWYKSEPERQANMTMQGFAGHVKIVWKFLNRKAGDMLLFKMKKAARECCSYHMCGKLHNLKKFFKILFSSSETEFLTWADPQVNWIPKGDKPLWGKMGHVNSFSLGRAQEEVLP